MSTRSNGHLKIVCGGPPAAPKPEVWPAAKMIEGLWMLMSMTPEALDQLHNSFTSHKSSPKAPVGHKQELLLPLLQRL